MALNAYRNEMNYGRRMSDDRMEMRDYRMEMRDYPPYGDDMRYETENRRRRDSRGRFMEYESPMTAHKEEWGEEHEKHDKHDKQSNVIGFKSKQEEHRKKSTEGGLDYEKAKKWVEKMGEHFSFDKSKAIMQRVDAMECNPIEFWAVLNSLYSDYGKVLEKFNMDSPEVYGALTKAWLEDEDAVENKVIEYLECIVKK
ncbi:MAG: hypothetical protein IKK29_05905 [Christensenellaceae bacterium]|nr:hypothetical protein [Christensenellaceae bacterium]